MQFKNPLIQKLTKQVMTHGKLELAQKIITQALSLSQEILEKEGIKVEQEELFQTAIEKGSPKHGVKSQRFRGSNCQIPVPLTTKEGQEKAIKFILQTSRNKKGYSMIKCLAYTLVDTYKGQGEVIKLCHESHKQSEAQKAFAHLTHLLVKKEPTQ